MIKIKFISENRKKYLDLLLLADEQESMIDRYLQRGAMYALYDGGLRAVCVVTDEGGGILEVKNLAVLPDYQRCGYGRRFLAALAEMYRGQYRIMQVGTGDSPLTLPFYAKCGFQRTHIIKNFFVDNYEHAIFEGGRQLRDMVYLQKKL